MKKNSLYILCAPMRGALLALGLMAIAATACINDNDSAAADLDDEPGTPIAATASTADATGSGGMLRALPTDIASITMYYPAALATDVPAQDPLTLTAYTVADATLTTPDATPVANQLSFKTDGNNNTLFWQGTMDKGLKAHDFFLTAEKPDDLSDIPNLSHAAERGNVLWAKATTDGKRSTLAFGNLSSRYARLTLIVKPAGVRPDLNVWLIKTFIKAMPAASASVANSLTDKTGIRNQAWPLAADGTLEKRMIIAGNTYFDVSRATSRSGAMFSTLAGSVLIAPQTLDASADANLLTLQYDRNDNGEIDVTTTGNTTEQWTLDLSKVKVTRPVGSPYYYTAGSTMQKNTAFAYNASEHITLTLTLNLSDELGAPDSIGISDYEASAADTTFDLDAEEEKKSETN